MNQSSKSRIFILFVFSRRGVPLNILKQVSDIIRDEGRTVRQWLRTVSNTPSVTVNEQISFYLQSIDGMTFRELAELLWEHQINIVCHFGMLFLLCHQKNENKYSSVPH